MTGRVEAVGLNNGVIAKLKLALDRAGHGEYFGTGAGGVGTLQAE